MLKGGGSENVGAQYKLPDTALGAGRDLKGVRKCVLDAVYKAQGQGCAPGVIGVGIGGDRATSYLLSPRSSSSAGWARPTRTRSSTPSRRSSPPT